MLRKISHTNYALVMFVPDRGWMFLEENGLLSVHPWRAETFTDYRAAINASYAITDTEYHVEVVRLAHEVQYSLPEIAHERRETA